MKEFLNLLRRWALFNKRLLKKPGFIAILLLIPVLVAALTIANRGEEKGVLTVALARTDNDDPLAVKITNELLDDRSLIRFVDCPSPAEAGAMVQNGRADAAWIFPADMQARIDRFSGQINERNAFITVIQREESILLQLSHEKLAAVLFPHCSRALYRDFVRDSLITLDDLTDQQLLTYYDIIQADGDDLFEFAYADSSSAEDRENDYILAPMRGLMAILILLGGLAVSLFYMQDEADRKFDWLPVKKRLLLSAGYQMTAIVDMAVIVVITLLVTGMSVSLGRELAVMLLYTVITAGFCIALRLICGDIRILGALIPVLAVASIALCPVFFRIVDLPAVQYLLPPFYYLNAVHDVHFLFYMLIYAAAVFLLDGLLFRLRER